MFHTFELSCAKKRINPNNIVIFLVHLELTSECFLRKNLCQILMTEKQDLEQCQKLNQSKMKKEMKEVFTILSVNQLKISTAWSDKVCNLKVLKKSNLWRTLDNLNLDVKPIIRVTLQILVSTISTEAHMKMLKVRVVNLEIKNQKLLEAVTSWKTMKMKLQGMREIQI